MQQAQPHLSSGAAMRQPSGRSHVYNLVLNQLQREDTFGLVLALQRYSVSIVPFEGGATVATLALQREHSDEGCGRTVRETGSRL